MGNTYEYSRNGEKVEVLIKSSSGEKLDIFKWNLNDKSTEYKMYKIMKNKYGMFKPTVEKPIQDDDLSWAK